MTNPLHDAAVAALDLTRVILTATELHEYGANVDHIAPAAINAAMEKVPAADLVAALTAHLIASLSIQTPGDPIAALDDLEQVSTLHRLDPGEDPS